MRIQDQVYGIVRDNPGLSSKEIFERLGRSSRGTVQNLLRSMTVWGLLRATEKTNPDHPGPQAKMSVLAYEVAPEGAIQQPERVVVVPRRYTAQETL